MKKLILLIFPLITVSSCGDEMPSTLCECSEITLEGVKKAGSYEAFLKSDENQDYQKEVEKKCEELYASFIKEGNQEQIKKINGCDAAIELEKIMTNEREEG